jgi:hypothetical protein
MAVLGAHQQRQQHLAQLETRHVVGVAAKDDVGAAAGHVGGDGDGAGAAGLGHDLGLPLHVLGLGVEQVVGNLLLGQQGREQFRLLHAGGAHQHRPALLVHGGGFSGHGTPLGGFTLVHLITPVGAGPGPVGGHHRDLELVSLLELHLFGLGGAGHAGQARVEQEEVLVRDRGEGLRFRLDQQALLGLDRLMLAIAPAPARHHPAGELIDNHRIAATHDVVDILDEQLLGLEGIGDVVGPGVSRVKHIAHPQHLLSLGIALIGKGAAALLLIHLVVALGIDAVLTHLGSAHQGGGHLRSLLVFLLRPLHLAGDDQGRAGLVDQDRVDLVDHAVLKLPLHHLGDVGGHVVAQVVEAQLAVGGIGDVTGIVGAPLRGRHVLLNQAHREAQEAVDLAHPLGVAAGQVVVHAPGCTSPAAPESSAPWPPGPPQSCGAAASPARC